MHDFHIANKIVQLVFKKAKENNFKTISQIEIGLGKIIEHGALITPENLRFNIKILAKGSIAENAKVVIYSIKGDSFILKSIHGDG